MVPEAELTIAIATFDQATAAIQGVRDQVFLQEQGIPLELERDGLDAEAQHLVAYLGQQPVGTARIRVLQPGAIAKIERVAVLAAYRNRGIGQRLMAVALQSLVEQGIIAVVLHAQLPSQDFYQRLGFEVQGEPFAEAGIAHVKMRKSLIL